MSAPDGRDPHPSDPEEPGRPDPDRMQPTPAHVPAVWAVVGLALGWLLHPLAQRLGGVPPIVTWVQVLGVWVVAVSLALTAWSTWRTVHVHRLRLEPHRAVNRLVLGRASALVGALVGGGYLGYALSWVGDRAELADQRMWRSATAALGGLLVVVAALLLERACRVRRDDPGAGPRPR